MTSISTTDPESTPEVIVIDSSVDHDPPAVETPAPQAEPAAKPPRERRSAPAWVGVYGAAVTILAALLLGFAADLSIVGSLEHHRAQRLGFADLRLALASGTAPVGPTNGNGVLLAQGTPIALLEIPAIAMNEVVFEGSTSKVLEKGPGHERLTPMPGQVGTSWLMGRRAAFGGPFASISKLRPHDAITVITGQGTSTYSVLDVRRAGDPQPPAPAGGEGRLQLITASGPAYEPNGVLRVDADLTSQPFGTPTALSGIPPLATAELPLKGDTSVLIVLVLWGEGLLLAVGLVAWARVRWGRWQTWIVAVPLLTTVGLALANRVAQLLPNLM